MQNTRLKGIFILGIFLIVSLLFATTVYGSNENIQILKESEQKYLIYVKDNLNKTFEFALSNDETEPTEYKDAGRDSAEGGNYIAYIDEYSTGTKYIWAKNSEGYILEGVELNLDGVLDNEDLALLQEVTKIIKVDTTKTKVEEKEVNGDKVKVTTGKLVFLNEGTHKYQMFKVADSEDYAEFMDLAERISKFNKDTDMYTQLEVYKEFASIAEGLLISLEDDWKDVEGNEIFQPEDAKNGDKYVVWLMEDDELDVQFLTSKYEEEKVKEKIETKLPVTYDDNRLLVVLVILVIATVAVTVRINSLKKEDK